MIFKKRKGQWARRQASQNRSLARQNRVLLTSYLMENGYNNAVWLSNFWGLSSSTIRDYKKEAASITSAQEDRDRIREIMNKEDCDIPEAVSIHYNELMSKGGCFIATAAYGTPLHYHIDILRDFRDKKMKKYDIGRLLIHIYYTLSPSLARIIRGNEKLKKIVRRMLRPLIEFLR